VPIKINWNDARSRNRTCPISAFMRRGSKCRESRQFPTMSQTAQTATGTGDMVVVTYLGELFFRAVQGAFCMTHQLPSAKMILSSSIGVILTILCAPFGVLCFIGAAASGGSPEGTIILAGLGLVLCAISICSITTAWVVLGGRVSVANLPRVARRRS